MYFIYRYGLARSIQRRIDAIHHAGFPATAAELNAWYVQPPPGENAADIYTQAFAHFEMWTNEEPHFVAPADAKDRAKYPWIPEKRRDLLPIVGMAKLPPNYGPLPEEQEKLVAEYLADNAEALKLLHQAASMKYCRYPTDLSEGAMMSLRHIGSLRQAEKLLELEVIHALDQKQQAQAIESAIAALSASRSLNEEPILISYLVQVACEGLALENVKRIVNTASLTDSQLMQLSAALQESDNLPSLTRALVGERCLQGDLFQDLHSGRTPIREMYSVVGDSGELPLLLVGVYKVSGLLDMDYRTYLDVMDGLVKAAELAPPQGIEAASAVGAQIQQLPRRRILTRAFTSSLALVTAQDAREEAQLRNAQVVIAIERYRLANNKLPDQLTDLVPTFLPSVPTDPFDGKPLRYKTLTKGYVVYSVGDDREDNGGKEKNDKGNWFGPGTDITFLVER